ncbi:MAG: hypothetical protein WBE34_11925, partial [Candidatus Nitrosopolaris sp.]
LLRAIVRSRDVSIVIIIIIIIITIQKKNKRYAGHYFDTNIHVSGTLGSHVCLFCAEQSLPN